MGLNVGNLPVKQVYVGSTPVTAVYVGSKMIWSAKERVQITLGTHNEARNGLRNALSDRGLNYTTVREIPFNIELVGTGVTAYMFQECAALTSVPAMDTSSVTDMESMFRDCSSLTTVPAMDTSNVTNMLNMFHGCSRLTTAPAMDTSSVTNMAGAFQHCYSLTSVPDMDTSNVTSAHYMFVNCRPLTDGNVRLIGKRPNVTTKQMISGSGLTRLPFYDTAGNPI